MNLKSGWEESTLAFLVTASTLIALSGGVFGLAFKFYLKSKERIQRDLPTCSDATPTGLFLPESKE